MLCVFFHKLPPLKDFKDLPTLATAMLHWVVDSQFATIRKLNGFARIRSGFAQPQMRTLATAMLHACGQLKLWHQDTISRISAEAHARRRSEAFKTAAVYIPWKPCGTGQPRQYCRRRRHRSASQAEKRCCVGVPATTHAQTYIA